MKLKVYNKTVFDREVSCEYNAEDIVCIKHHTYKDMRDACLYDMSNIGKSEICMEICFKDGTTATFPCSKWNIEFIG